MTLSRGSFEWAGVVSGLVLSEHIGNNDLRPFIVCSAKGVLVADSRFGGKNLFQKVRLYTFTGIALLAVIVIFQNTKPVTTDLLFWSLDMPRAALLSVTMLAGFAGGVIWTGLRRWRERDRYHQH